MSTPRPFQFRFLTTLTAVALAAWIAGHAICTADPAADAARKRSEIERKGRELKKEVEARQRAVRARLNLPNSAGTQSSASATKPAPPNGSAASAPLKDLRLPELPAGARKPAGIPGKNGLTYSPKRGQEF